MTNIEKNTPEAHKKIIRHMLGLDERGNLKGCRNFFATYADGKDYATLRDMERVGLVIETQVSPSRMYYFSATEFGLKAVGYEDVSRHGKLAKLSQLAAHP